MINLTRHLAVTSDNREIAQASYETNLAYGHVQNSQALVMLYESLLSTAAERWTPASSEYKKYYMENLETSFRKAVDELEKAVVMQICELTKMKATGTGENLMVYNDLMVSKIGLAGYKLRQHIAKALNRRSETVRKAIRRYNDQGKLLDPPVEPITWEEIAEYSFIGEFDLLRITRSEIRKEKWTKMAYRAAAVKYYKLCRAREEVQRLNIEVRRLRAFIHEEADHMKRAIERLSTDHPLLADELHYRWMLRSSINLLHLERLQRLEHQPYYTGSQGLEENVSIKAIFPLGISDSTLEEEDQIEAETEQERDFSIVVDFVANIT